MKKTLTLKNPITVDGVEITELTYDANEITPPLFAQAEALKKEAAGMKNVAIVPAVEFDFSLHMYLGFAAVIAVNQVIDFSDLERIHGADIMKLSRVGRDFTLGVEESVESSSDEQSEITAEPTTPPLLTSNENP